MEIKEIKDGKVTVEMEMKDLEGMDLIIRYKDEVFDSKIVATEGDLVKVNTPEGTRYLEEKDLDIVKIFFRE